MPGGGRSHRHCTPAAASARHRRKHRHIFVAVGRTKTKNTQAPRRREPRQRNKIAVFEPCRAVTYTSGQQYTPQQASVPHIRDFAHRPRGRKQFKGIRGQSIAPITDCHKFPAGWQRCLHQSCLHDGRGRELCGAHTSTVLGPDAASPIVGGHEMGEDNTDSSETRLAGIAGRENGGQGAPGFLGHRAFARTSLLSTGTFACSLSGEQDAIQQRSSALRRLNTSTETEHITDHAPDPLPRVNEPVSSGLSREARFPPLLFSRGMAPREQKNSGAARTRKHQCLPPVISAPIMRGWRFHYGDRQVKHDRPRMSTVKPRDPKRGGGVRCDEGLLAKPSSRLPTDCVNTAARRSKMACPLDGCESRFPRNTGKRDIAAQECSTDCKTARDRNEVIQRKSS